MKQRNGRTLAWKQRVETENITDKYQPETTAKVSRKGREKIYR